MVSISFELINKWTIPYRISVANWNCMGLRSNFVDLKNNFVDLKDNFEDLRINWV